jgi:spore maturation protein CgeB
VRIVVFGLTISSSWGNGHATLWRGLCKNLVRCGHSITFFERDVPWYAGARDLFEIPGGRLVLYPSWDDVRGLARTSVGEADVAIVTSYCPDALAATALLLDQDRATPVFYDMDTPVTLSMLRAGEAVPYVGPAGLDGFALVLSFTGGRQLFEEYQHRLAAANIKPLYGHVDPDIHRPVAAEPHYRADLSYLGTYSEDRQAALEELLVAPARSAPDLRFLIGGAQYPAEFPWAPNIYFVRHLPPSEHAAFFASSRLTLNVTRRAMAEMGWCPSGRLFEAAACGAPLLSDTWPGLEEFFTPGEEILLACNASDTLKALQLDAGQLSRIARRARERALDQHSSQRRAAELVVLLEQSTNTRTPQLEIQGA